MLKFINYQLENDKKQSELERDISAVIKHRIPLNFNAFKTYSPQISEIIRNIDITDHSIFCTGKGQLNITNISSGRVLYSSTPEQEMQNEVEQFLQLAPVIHLNSPNPEMAEPLPAKVDVVMIWVWTGLSAKSITAKCPDKIFGNLRTRTL
jgi:hypothetical protein